MPDLLRHSAAFAALFLAACAAAPAPSMFQDADRGRPQKIAPRPDYPGYGSAIAHQRIPWTLDSLVADFVDLQFQTEWGGGHERLLRWDGPVTVALEGEELSAYRDDVEALLSQLNAAAPGLGATIVADRADITIRTAPRDDMKATADTALCFFAPVDMDWEAYKAADAVGEAGWDGIERLEKITIFIPEHAAPHVFRICFVEEIMQALGPGNDLYRLEDSGFNDDEVHIAPTAFDLLMIRTLYNGELRPGMTEPEARAAAREVLAGEIDPSVARVTRERTEFDEDFQLYHYFADVRGDPKERRELLDLANRAAEHFAPTDHRIGEALRAEAYFASERRDDRAAVGFARAAVAHFERTLPPSSARLARTRADLGLFLVLDGEFEEAAAVLADAEPWLAAHGKEDDLASVLRLRAIALAQMGEAAEAQRTARRALAWAAYVFGADSLALSEWRKQFRDFEIVV